MRMINKIGVFATYVAAFALLVPLSSCGDNEADVASRNLSQDADNFRIERRVTFYNTRLGVKFLEVEGKCSLGNNDTTGRMSVTCKTASDTYLKHYLGLARDVTFVSEQLEAVPENTYHYKVTWAPSTFIPNINVR